MEFKRDKVLGGKTYSVKMNCGSLSFTFNYQEDKLVEIFGVIGKSGVCPHTLLDSWCKVVSCYLQSPEPRYKIIKKFNKQFVGMPACEMNKFTFEEKEYTSCVDIITQKIIEELEKQIE